MNKKILVAVPYHKAKRYSMKHLLNVVDKLTYKNKEVIVMKKKTLMVSLRCD